jgi:hypothetical protein
MPLDERVLRKPGYSEGIKVTMADGQDWALAKSRIRFIPRVVDDKVEIGGGPSSGCLVGSARLDGDTGNKTSE